MARTETPVDRPTLMAALALAEDSGPLANLDALWKASAGLYNKSKPASLPEITFSVVLSRAASWGLMASIKTQPGKKGRKALAPEEKALVGERLKAGREAGSAERKPKTRQAVTEDAKAEMLRRAPASMHSLVHKVCDGKGSKSAALKLNCLQCCGYARKEVARCSVYTCPWWRFRPYQQEKRVKEASDTPQVETLD